MTPGKIITIKQPRLSGSDWATIITLYERGDKNVRELAEQFGISRQNLQKGLSERGIVKGSRLDEVSRETTDHARLTREKDMNKANEMRDHYVKWVDIIAKVTMKKVIDGEKSGNLHLATPHIIALKGAMQIIEKARSESWIIMGIDDLLGEGAELPDLNVGEYTPAELEQIREGNEVTYLEGLEGDEEEFSDLDEE